MLKLMDERINFNYRNVTLLENIKETLKLTKKVIKNTKKTKQIIKKVTPKPYKQSFADQVHLYPQMDNKNQFETTIADI